VGGVGGKKGKVSFGASNGKKDTRKGVTQKSRKNKDKPFHVGGKCAGRGQGKRVFREKGGQTFVKKKKKSSV